MNVIEFKISKPMVLESPWESEDIKELGHLIGKACYLTSSFRKWLDLNKILMEAEKIAPNVIGFVGDGINIVRSKK